MMWELGNVWGDQGKYCSSSSTTPMANSYLSVMHEIIHVLLVDHDTDGRMNTTNLLEICQYKVTFVELASAAMQMLSSGKAKFDIVMVNINSPDLHGFKLLQQAINMDIPVILMSVDDNPFMAMRAIENGAFLYIKKPATMEMLSCLWQHVLREKTRMIRESDRFMAATNYSASTRGIEFREVMNMNTDANPNINVGGTSNMIMMNDDKLGKLSKKKIIKAGRKLGANGEEEYAHDSNLNNHIMMINGSKIKRKVCTEWTEELHERFVEAVEELGEGRCFPKEILELMNVPGLTRMQVASHLQKCRNENWRSPEERKTNQSTQPASSDTNGPSQNKPRRFGSMPRLAKAKDSESSGVGQGSKSTNSEIEMPNDVGGIDNVGTYTLAPPHHQYQVQHYGSMVPHPNIINVTIPNQRHQSDDFFSFPDMECLIQNYSHQASHADMVNNLNSGSGGYHFAPFYNDQNSAVPSMNPDTGSHWSSETSHFGSDDYSDTRGH